MIGIGFQLAIVLLNNVDMSLEVRVVVFGLFFPLIKSAFHNAVNKMMSTAGSLDSRMENFTEERKADLIAILNMTVEVTCNLGQMV